MNTQEVGIHFKGILANVDSSILQMDFNHGFKIESFSEEEAVAFFSSLEEIPFQTIAQKYFIGFQCYNFSEQRIYTISKTLENMSSHDPSKVFSETTRFDNTLVRGHLEPVIRLMRLFKEGDIRMPVRFYYRVQNDTPQGSMHVESGGHVSNEPYHLEASEMPALQSLIQSVELPFKRDFLHLAFENFELSYEISDMQLAFLVLMIGLETLLNPSLYEVRYRVSRNAAVLLGKNREHSEEIFAQVKKLYDKRSKIVHSGKRKTIEKRDLLELRDYLRKAIIEIHHIGKEKNEITDSLDSHGFGEKSKNLESSSTSTNHNI